MFSSPPPGILNDTNKDVLDYIKDLSAHDGVASELINAVSPLGDVQVYCPDPGSFRYVVAATNNIIFGIAHGMDTVAFRLDPATREKSLLSGCNEHPGLATGYGSTRSAVTGPRSTLNSGPGNHMFIPGNPA